MNGQLFRKSSIQRISSPEQLDDYVKVSSLGVWMVLLAVIILLVGVCVWGIFGHLDTRLDSAGTCEDGGLTCYVRESDIEAVRKAAGAGMELAVAGQSFQIVDIGTAPVAISQDADDYLLYLGGFHPGEWVYEVKAKTTLPDGIYEVFMITERISPMSFLLNTTAESDSDLQG